MAIQSKETMAKMVKKFGLSCYHTPLSIYPNFWSSYLTYNREKEKEMSFLPEGTIKKCWNHRCACRNVNKEYKCDRYLKAPEHKCSKFVSFENRKSVNNPNQLKNKSMHNMPISIDLEVKRLRKLSKKHWSISPGSQAAYFAPDKQENSYTFRGEIKVDHLINDCLKDNKNTFLAISKSEGIIGISKQLKVKDKSKFYNKLTDPWEDDVQKAFYVFYINKKDIPLVINELNKISKKLRNKAMSTAKKLRKASKQGKFSKMPETKVMVF